MNINLTNDGKDLILHNLTDSEVEIRFTGIGLGNGEDAGGEEAHEMSNRIVLLGLTEYSLEENPGFITLKADMNNSQISSRFKGKEIGIYTNDPEDEEGSILFAYTYVSDEEATVYPANTDYYFESVLQMLVYIGAAQNVTATISSSMQYVSRTDFEAHTGDRSNPHSVTKNQVGLGNVPNVETNNQTPTFTESGTLQNLVSGERLSVAFGKIGKAIRDLISHIGNNSNPHGVTAAQVGAALSSHNHSASNITSGIIPLARGGTGVTTYPALRKLLGFGESTGPLGIQYGGTGGNSIEQIASMVSGGVFVIGSYIGNGEVARDISLGFKPKAIILADYCGRTSDDVDGSVGGIAIPNHGVVRRGGSQSFAQIWSNDSSVLAITESGFRVNYNATNRVYSNESSRLYYYIAIR